MSSPPTPGSRPATNATDDARHRSNDGSRSPTSTRSARQLRSTARRCATPPQTCPAPPRKPHRDPSSGVEALPSTTADGARTTRATLPGRHWRSRQPAPHHSTTTDQHSRPHSRATTAQRFTRCCSPPSCPAIWLVVLAPRRSCGSLRNSRIRAPYVQPRPADLPFRVHRQRPHRRPRHSTVGKSAQVAVAGSLHVVHCGVRRGQ